MMIQPIQCDGAEMNLVETYLEVKCANGEPHRLALRDLNRQLGSSYKIARLYAWRSGARSIPRPVQDVMMREVLFYAIRQSGGWLPWDRESQEQLLQRITPPSSATRQSAVASESHG